jgi:hypothetical protein
MILMQQLVYQIIKNAVVIEDVNLITEHLTLLYAQYINTDEIFIEISATAYRGVVNPGYVGCVIEINKAVYKWRSSDWVAN